MKQFSFKTKILVGIIFILSNNINVYSQGGWDIAYVTIDSLNHSFIGKEIRLDFKGAKTDVIVGVVNALDIRKLLRRNDTANLSLSRNSYDFIEQWSLYVDHGSLRDQSLISLNQKEVITIKEMFLIENKNSTMVIEAWIYDSKGNKKQETIKISKCAIKGILTKRN